MSDITVIKATGEKEPFSEEKLRNSITRAGVPRDLHDAAVSHIKSILYPEIHTSEIYKHILEYLSRSPSPHSQARYSLKKAIMDLGPTGFPFEKFIAAILKKHGYKVDTDVTINGLCIAHEIDVIAQKNDQKIMIECKFHNKIGNRTDVKVALYVFARYQDLTAGWIDRSNTTRFNEVWLVTNTKATQDAVSYARCMSMKIVSWGYPEYGNLQDLIEADKLHPITCLTNITNYHKKILLENNIVLCRDLLDNQMYIDLLKLSSADEQKLLTELKAI